MPLLLSFAAVLVLDSVAAGPQPAPIRTLLAAEAAAGDALRLFAAHGKCNRLTPRVLPVSYRILDADQLVKASPGLLTFFRDLPAGTHAFVERTATSLARVYLLPAFFRLGYWEQLAVLYHEIRGHVFGNMDDRELGRRLQIRTEPDDTHRITTEILCGCPSISPSLRAP